MAELEAGLSSAEFVEWMDYWQLEPFGPAREDARAYITAAALANLHRAEGTRPIDLNQMLPAWTPPPTPEARKALARLQRLQAAMKEKA